MRLAADLRFFDEDLIGRDLYENEVEVIQYLRPNGRRRRVTVPCDEADALLIKSFPLVLEAEVLPGNKIAIWVRLVNESDKDEIMELAENGPGHYSPTAVLMRLAKMKIDQLLEAKNESNSR